MNYYLAPLEGITTLPFRLAYHKYYGGIEKYFTPFLSSGKLNENQRAHLDRANNAGMTLIPQILTNSVDSFMLTANQLAELGYSVVNINLGCPSGTVVAKKRGAGALDDLRTLEQFLQDIFEQSPLKISIKTRIGMFSESDWEDILKLYLQFPFEELIVHPRIGKQGYAGSPNLDAYELAYRLVAPEKLVYNGDITDIASQTALLARFPSTQNLMIGRGLLMHPGLVPALAQNKPLEPIDYMLFREFHNDLLHRYQELMQDDSHVLFKMKDLWKFMEKAFPNQEKALKEIRKSKTVSAYKIAVGQLFY